MEGDGRLCSPSLFNAVSHVDLQQGWKGSVKATHFVIALHDHFALNAGQALRQTQTIENASSDALAETTSNAHIANATDTDTSVPDTAAEDSWALEYINIRQIQPLIEAIDDDGSSFVTVNEVNDFTSHRPTGWRWVPRLTIDSFCPTLTYTQSPSLDRILDDRLRDDD
jgi:hypothetical protein